MKKVIILIIACVLLLSISACSDGTALTDSPSNTIGSTTPSNSITPTEPSDIPQSSDIPETPQTSEEMRVSDPLPSIWFGDWVCVYTEAMYFKEEETIFVKDFDNAVLYVSLAGGSPFEMNRWFCYDDAEQVIYIYNEPPPFPLTTWRDGFEVKRVTDNEIVLTRLNVGQEVRFERPF